MRLLFEFIALLGLLALGGVVALLALIWLLF
jgi:hypothetical protein